MSALPCDALAVIEAVLALAVGVPVSGKRRIAR